MTWLRRLLVVMLAFGAGVLVDAIGVALWIQRFECMPTPGDPCDGGFLIALGAFLVTAPVAGLLAAIVAIAWMAVRAHRSKPAASAATS